MSRLAGILSLLVLAGCRGQQYFAEGPGRSANVSGEYRTEERPGRNNCRTFSPEVEDRIVVKATVTVTAADDLPPEMPRRRGSSPAQPRSCEYVLQWDGKKVE